MKKHTNTFAALASPVLLMMASQAEAAIPGIGRVATDTTSCSGAVCSFSLTSKADRITLGDGNSLLAWGFADDRTGQMQYPGPTLIVNEGDTVNVTLSSDLEVPASIVFPGQIGVTTTGGDLDGPLAREVFPGGTPVVYTFVASEPGTYLYQSGSQPEIQIEMGLTGALIVRPSGYDASTERRAYATPGSAYDREYLFFLSEMDRSAHDAIDEGLAVDPATFSPTLWFINGRSAMDTLFGDGASWLPAQPYGSLVVTHPGDRVLTRFIGGGRDLHPFHLHGNNDWLIARDGRLLQSSDGTEALYPDFQPPRAPLFDNPAGVPHARLDDTAMLPDQAINDYMNISLPGGTEDAIWTWTGRGLNWDIYGNAQVDVGGSVGLIDGHVGDDCWANFDDTLGRRTVGGMTSTFIEDANSHCKDLTVVLPEQQSLTFGGLWTGQPYLGALSALPPGEGGLNPTGGFAYMWHSHAEKELANDDVFPGGMLTIAVVVPAEVCLAEAPGDCP